MRLFSICQARLIALAAHGGRHPTRFPVLAGLAATFMLGIAPLALAQPPATSAAAPVSALPGAHPYTGYVADASRRFGIPEAWIWSVMRVESAGNPVATSHAGAMGLMQIMPRTYAELRSRYGLGPDPYDARDSILAGAAYLREMHDRYGPTGFLAAYNAGPGRWVDYLSHGRALPAETVAYMARLAPMVGSTPAPAPIVVPQDEALTWTRAALFVRPTNGQTPIRLDDWSATPSSQRMGREIAPDQVSTPPALTDTMRTPTEAPHALFAVRRPK